MADYAIHRTFLEAMIANRTTPSVAVIVDRLFVEAGVVALIKVPKSRQLVATSDGTLGMTASVDGVLKPTVAGLIVLGRDVDIKRHLPFNEIAFQVLEGSELRINQFLRKPLLKAFEEIETLLNAKIV